MENDGGPLPALRRDLDVSPYEHSGKSMFVVRDKEGLLPQPVVVSSAAMILASFLDGKHTAEEVRRLFAQITGTVLDRAEVLRIVAELGKIGLVETPEIIAEHGRFLKEFIESPVRKAVHLGNGGYPSGKQELSKFLGAFFRDAKGPGKGKPDLPSGTSPKGLVSPHIDFFRGGPAYAWAYQALAQTPPPDAIVALGVAHISPDSPWIMTPKAYETPFGRMRVDTELYNDIKKSLWYDPRRDEWAHRNEHSLEFQAVWLKYIWGNKTPPWVPILCSSFEGLCDEGTPSTVPTIENALEEIGERLKKRAKKKRILVLAGVDLAHVGPCFGDPDPINRAAEKRIETEDRRSIEHLLDLDAEAFYGSVVAGDHWRKVCGLSTLYTAARWIRALNNGIRGELLTYGQAADPRGGVVSFTSAIYR